MTVPSSILTTFRQNECIIHALTSNMNAIYFMMQSVDPGDDISGFFAFSGVYKYC